MNMFHWIKENGGLIYLPEYTATVVDLNSRGNTIPGEGDSLFSHPLLTEQKETALGCCEKARFNSRGPEQLWGLSTPSRTTKGRHRPLLGLQALLSVMVKHDRPWRQRVEEASILLK